MVGFHVDADGAEVGQQVYHLVEQHISEVRRAVIHHQHFIERVGLGRQQGEQCQQVVVLIMGAHHHGYAHDGGHGGALWGMNRPKSQPRKEKEKAKKLNHQHQKPACQKDDNQEKGSRFAE